MGSAYPVDSVPLEEAIKESVTILVAEDDVFQRMTVADELRKQGYNVVEAVNADEALSIIQSGTRIHALFTDISMPGSLDGIGLARVVCAAFPRVQVTLTSGHLASMELDDKISGFFPKPYDVQKLVAHIKSHFDSGSARSPSTVVKP
jgi:DNA-binding NtrC family response regulator